MNEKINLQDLATRLAERAEITKKDAETFLREYFEVMSEGLISDNLLKMRDLGTFKLLMVDDRESVDVTTGERFVIPAHYKVAFTPDKQLAETVNDPFAFFETTEMDEKSASDELKSFSEENPSTEPEPVFENEEEDEEPVFEEEIVLEEAEAPVVEEEIILEEEEPVLEKEIIPDDEEEMILEEKPVFEEAEEEIIPEEAEAPVVEEEMIPENFRTEGPAVPPYCHNCYDYRAHIEYRKNYFSTLKKLKWQRRISILLAILLAMAAGYIAVMYFGLGGLKYF